MRPTLRQATSTDHHRLEELQQIASLATGEHHQELLDNPDVFGISAEHLAHSLVAELNGQAIGFCTVLPASSDVAEVDAIFIDPAAWRKGVGRMLLIEAERRTAAAGAKTLVVTSGGYAVSFYQALGFRISGTDMTEFGPAARLVKTLNRP